MPPRTLRLKSVRLSAVSPANNTRLRPCPTARGHARRVLRKINLSTTASASLRMIRSLSRAAPMERWWRGICRMPHRERDRPAFGHWRCSRNESTSPTMTAKRYLLWGNDSTVRAIFERRSECRRFETPRTWRQLRLQRLFARPPSIRGHARPILRENNLSSPDTMSGSNLRRPERVVGTHPEPATVRLR
jgi:hypothetical protein